MGKKDIYLQQGDVILYRVDSIPPNATRREIKGNTFVIERGEGVNTHKVKRQRLAQSVQIFEDKDNLYLQTQQEIELVHTEHGTSVIEPNVILMKKKEREWDYETEEARLTRD